MKGSKRIPHPAVALSEMGFVFLVLDVVVMGNDLGGNVYSTSRHTERYNGKQGAEEVHV